MPTREDGVDTHAHALRKQGWTISAIARHLDHDCKTIRAYLTGERVAGQQARSAEDPLGPSIGDLRQRLTGVSTAASPHSLRRTSCTAGLINRVPLRDMQYALRHADARTTIGYDMARANLDRHSAHSVAAYLAGMAMG